jgi:outer membrane protein assembly factor BamE (lipoprotein component of BamABCDE complex)
MKFETSEEKKITVAKMTVDVVEVRKCTLIYYSGGVIKRGNILKQQNLSSNRNGKGRSIA